MLDKIRLMFKYRCLNNYPMNKHEKRHCIWLIFAGFVCVAAYLYLAFLTQGNNQPDLIEFLVSMIVCALVTFALCTYCFNQGIQISVPLMLMFALIFRLIAIWGFPVFEDDFYRYLWDGKIFVETGSPYGVAPAEFFDVSSIDEKFEEVLSHINHPNIATVYGPFCQWVFGFAYLIAPGEIWPLQVIFAAADMAIIIMLLQLARPNWVLLYAWSPLMIKEFAFTAHPDVLGVALLLGALLLLRKNQWFPAAVLLALAAATKIFALILIPFMLLLHIRAWAVFIVTALLVALPFGLLDAWRPEGLSAMAESWLFNAPLYYFFGQWVSISTLKLVLLGSFVLVWGLYLLRAIFTDVQIPRADCLYGLFFLCVPVLNAWYFVWLLPFAVIYPSATAWVASVALFLSYGVGLNIADSGLDIYQQPTALLIIQFSLIAVAFIWDVWRSQKGKGLAALNR